MGKKGNEKRERHPVCPTLVWEGVRLVVFEWRGESKWSESEGVLCPL